MVNQVLNSSKKDSDGRQLLLNDDIISVLYYSAENESWDKSAAGGQSWYNENFVPNDDFTTSTILSDRWSEDNTAAGTSTQSSSLNLQIDRSEGVRALTSDGKWRLSGDFEIRLYIDWSNYYNEYRSITDSFFDVWYDSENVVRMSFSWDGSNFVFRSLKSVGKDVKFFDWTPNGDVKTLSSFSSAEQYKYFKITRISGSIKCFISTGSSDTQIGDTVSDAVFSNDLFVRLGIEAKEYNSLKTTFNKFQIRSGGLDTNFEFFSEFRGTKREFPDRTLIVLEEESLSIIDEQTNKLWMRFLIGAKRLITSSSIKYKACNGSLYITTADGLLDVNFPSDTIYRYSGNIVEKSSESISFRNSLPTFFDHTSIGQLASGELLDVHCKVLSGSDVVAVSTESGVCAFTPLASGIAKTTTGTPPFNKVFISDGGSLYWSGYDSSTGQGELSYVSNISNLIQNDSSFTRSGYYDKDTSLNIISPNITSIAVQTVDTKDLIALGTGDGISFISFSPAAPATESVSYGVLGSKNNISDPSFERQLALDWAIEYDGYHEVFIAHRSDEFSTDEPYSVKMQFRDPGISSPSFIPSGTLGGVYQDTDLTNIDRLYYSLKVDSPTAGSQSTTNVWDAKVIVDGQTLKSYRDIDGPFEKEDSVDTSSFSGVSKLQFAIQTVSDINTQGTHLKAFYVDNLRTDIGTADHKILSPGELPIKEVLLQYDNEGHKIYFASPGGYGAIDLDGNVLDYFNPITGSISDSSVNDADFSRAEEDGS